MKGVAKDKVVTSGRLTGKVKPQSQRRLIPNQMAVFPEPAYPLYSSDSQEQVASLHNSLDRYDAFLSGILQADESDLGGPKDAAVKSKLPASSGRKIVKKTPAKTDRKSHAAPQGAGITTPRTTRHPMVPVAHSGLILFPTRKKYQNALSRLQTQLRTPSAPRHADPVRVPGSKPRHESGEEDLIPVRDISPQIGNLKRPEKNQAEEVKDPCSADDEGEVKMQTVQYLLRELKALIIGEGSLAEMLLRRLEQAMTSPLVNTSIQSDADVLLLQSQNIQLRRDVEELQQQLKLREQAEIEKGNDLCSSQVSVTEKDLTAALSQLHELQDNLSELQKAHHDTQNQLKEKEMINTLIVSDLEATRNRLLDSEREKDELTTQYQQRLKEVEHLKRDLQSRFSSSDCTFVGSSVSQQPRDEEVTEHINHYLTSIWPETTARDRAPENGQTAVQQGGPPAQNAAHGGPRQDLEPGLRKDLPHERMSSCTVSQCDEDSLCSDWSLKSGSTFNTRDEAAFRDGLSALDTSIANLLKSFQLHHERKCS